MEKICVVLNGYKRPHTLNEQIESVKNNSIKPNEILFWKNDAPGIDFYIQEPNLKIAASNVNWGVWSRFYYALNSKSDYICVFDDDTIPGEEWFENCVSSFHKQPGLYGTIGILFKNNSYSPLKRYGWDGSSPIGENNNEIKEVDIVGHSWFFHRDMLSIFCRELPPPEHNFIVGEDIHFSWMLQKYSNYKTYVPPHPTENKKMWGSTKALIYGTDHNATANFAVPLMNDYLQKAISSGFQLIKNKK
jgi:GT2 family glycosyltransferase